MDDRLIEKLVMEHPELKWYIDTVNINKEFEGQDLEFDEFIQTISEDKRDLYLYDGWRGIIPDWIGIYCKLFNKDKLEYSEGHIIGEMTAEKTEHIEIPNCEIPYGMKEFFEIDEQGKPTGNFNWEYIMSVRELTSQIEKDSPMTLYVPDHVGQVLENLDNPSELFEILFSGGKNSKTGVDLNCPFNEIRDNKNRMLDIIKVSGESLASVNIWELASDRLKNDPDFISKVEVRVGKEIFGCIAEFEGLEPEELLEREPEDDGYSHIDSDDLEFSETSVEGHSDTIDEIYHISPDELEMYSPEELVAVLSELLTKNKEKQKELDNSSDIKRVLISKIIAAQQEGKSLDAQIREAKSQNRGE